jgi:phage gpG-like protein
MSANAEFEITDNSQEFIDVSDEAIARALEACGIQAEKYAKMKCPVGTPESTGIPGYMGGTLRNSLTHAVTNEPACYIGTNIYYAP